MYKDPSRSGVTFSREYLPETVEKVKQFAVEDGYEIGDVILCDFGRTVKMHLTKDGQEYSVSIIEQFYDTDEHGEIVKYRGQIDIRDTPWFKNKLAEEQQDG